jgi:phospholipid-binding lipoprotein MlaA
MRRSACFLLLAFLLASPAFADPVTEYDPFQGFNRRVFWLNDKMDRYAIEPIARGWEFITPEVVPRRLNKFFLNTRFPVRFVSNVLQLKVRQSGVEVARFGINTTVGLLGFFDPAAHWGLEHRPEDVGQAFGRWGVGPGPYLVLPFFGPSNPRDTVGLVADTLIYRYPIALIERGLLLPISIANLINTRTLALDDVREARAASLDYYVFVRNGYMQLREARIRDGEVPPEEPIDDLYDFEE